MGKARWSGVLQFKWRGYPRVGGFAHRLGPVNWTSYGLHLMSSIYEFDESKDLPPKKLMVYSFFSQVAIRALEIPETTIVLTRDNRNWAKDNAAYVRKAPPLDWPSGVWRVVGRVWQVKELDYAAYDVGKPARYKTVTRGSRLFITYMGPAHNPDELVFQFPKSGRPKKNLKPWDKDNLNFRVHKVRYSERSPENQEFWDTYMESIRTPLNP